MNNTKNKDTSIQYRSIKHISISDFEALEKYKNSSDPSEKSEMLDELLHRHSNLLRRIAWKIHRRYPQNHSFEDCAQYAFLGAIVAYNRFDFSKQSSTPTKLSSFVQLTVELYILDSLSRDSLIQCPSNQRAMRSYLTGKYDHDSEKKRSFEMKHGLLNDEARAYVREKFRGLLPEISSFDNEIEHLKHYSGDDHDTTYLDLIPDNTSNFEDQILNKIFIKDALSNLNNRQKMVCELIFEKEYSKPEAAEILTEALGQPITAAIVKADVQFIKKTLSSCM